MPMRSCSLLTASKCLSSDSVSQRDTVISGTAANATHRLSQVDVYIDGHTAHVSGVLECVYAHTGAYTTLLASAALPKPKCGLAYCDTPAGSLAIGEGEIKVHGGTVGATYRWHDSYAAG